LLFLKYNWNRFNILDIEKKALTLKTPVQLDTLIVDWIDACQGDGTLLAAGGTDNDIKIYDIRESRVVNTFNGIHSGKMHVLIYSHIFFK
jgi:hypothetical protein